LPSDPRARAAVVVIGGLVGFLVVLEVIDRLSPTPQGPRSSSYATAPAGLAAYASLLERAGHPVRRLRVPIAGRPPRMGETLVVLDPSVMEPGEERALGDWVRAGGRLVAGGSGDPTWLDEVLDEEVPRWGGDGPSRRPVLAPVLETAGVREVVSAGGGAWHELGAALPVIGPADAPLLVTARSGRGTVALLADASPLQNRRLAHADGAALGLALAGGARRPVAFLETVHGYGAARGIAGLPASVKWALIGLALTALVAVWAAGRRLGPPEDPEDPLPPPRVEYVDALAAALVRAKPEKNKKERS
jgi:hypothetical protein